MIRVLIVEDQRMAREDMENYIQSSGRYCLAASITNAAMAETVCRQSKCELVLMDVCTENDESGLVAAEKIKRTMPQIKIIIVTSLVECSFIDRARKAGVESFWYKGTVGGYGSHDERGERVSGCSAGCDDRNSEKL